ncbi:PREDICTED: essential MCU regulator, mitochondrial [Nanorana parkeri]|uniref:essential MCU regulator, mitochondrial n=1 Tax=Nanorana parkeri TaxID=125878 RepID=UPI00085488D9|nr:PREDICTED: essential MCU regulator, mitochondrial [Nanorana parkeri]
MAASIGVYSARLAARVGGLLRAPGKPTMVIGVPRRTAVTTNTGAIYPKPEKVSFGLLRVFTVVVPFLYIGTLISKNFAALLEEHDIFVPEDDDDDD